MKKNKLYLIITLIFIIISCKTNNIKNGIIYSKGSSDLSFDASKEIAMNNAYYYIAENTANTINRTDYNVISFFLKDKNIIDLSNNTKVKKYKKDDIFYTEIKIKDKNIYSNSVEILKEIKNEGLVGKKYSANASIELTEKAKLSPYTRQILTHSALENAYLNLYRILLNDNIDFNKIITLTNNAYILEENYSANEYSVVIETEIE